MYIHLGDDFVVSTRDIVGIFDFKANMSPIVEEFLKKTETQGGAFRKRHAQIYRSHGSEYILLSLIFQHIKKTCAIYV